MSLKREKVCAMCVSAFYFDISSIRVISMKCMVHGIDNGLNNKIPKVPSSLVSNVINNTGIIKETISISLYLNCRGGIGI